MQFKNTDKSYGAVTKTFHWLSALLVIGLICVGLYFSDMPNSPATMHTKLQLVTMHKSFGIIVLCLTVLRIIWHIYTRKPGLVDGMKKWERVAAKGAHYFLYFAMLALPLSGWGLTSAAGRPVKLFGLDALTLPDLVAKNHDLKETLEDFHSTVAWILIGVIAVHAAAALKHHIIEKDSTLRRMLPFCKGE
ncbi:MAG: cytochrome b [Alphaproteobacteria bacterium]|nr:cytochrome b [Alphaproteobacteria bacterium]